MPPPPQTSWAAAGSRAASPPTYTVTECISEGGKAQVYRAIQGADHLPVVLKVLDPRRSGPKDLERLKSELALGATLATTAAVRPLALATYQGMPALVLEDFGGRSLDASLGEPLPVERFLALAVAIADAVADIHRRGVLHKDLKPQNILVNPATGEVKIADFGLASLLPREHQPARPPPLIEGSLPYLAPEQTGRTNRAIDGRADLYALGVTFYQMLTGRLPFEARDPAEWVHCHVARAPPSPAEVVPGVPEMLARIVVKLLAKTPEDRYQSARGLRIDLERCRAEWSARGRIEPFPPASRDATGSLQLPGKLHGREAETALLLGTFARVVEGGAPELLLVAGDPGIGKSALVQELHKPLAGERGLFASGKFDQQRRDVPYSTLVQAFRELTLAILAGTEEEIATWRESLLGALGSSGQLVVEVIPQVELVIGRQPPVPELPPTEAQNRFRRVLRRFIGVFARREHPLALFLDDLQWADPASLGLLQDLLTHADMRHLLVIGAYRDGEVPPSHPLAVAVDAVRRAGVRVSEVTLGPLSPEQLAAFVGAALRCPVEAVGPLSALVHEQTAGNPFFAIQLLISLYEDRLLEFDGRAEAWRWDVGRIREKGFTENVVDLMVGRVRRLPRATQEALTQLACLGSSAEASVLSTIRKSSEEETHAALWEAVRAGLIVRLEDRYKFLHDRIQEAAYSLVPERSRAAMHLAIGRLLAARTAPDRIEDAIFEIVGQLDRGAELITSREEREQVAEWNLVAGRRAKRSTAFATALALLAAGAALLPEDGWDRRYDLALALTLDRAECEYLVGHFERADELLDLVLARARTTLERARAYQVRMRLYQLAGRFGDAMKATFEAVRLFGVTFPTSAEGLAAAAEAEAQAISTRLSGRSIAGVADAPLNADVDASTAVTLLVESLPAAYVTAPDHFRVIAGRAVNLALTHGNSAEACHAYSAYAAIALTSSPADARVGFELSEMSLRLNEKLDDRRLRGQILLIHGDHINYWRRHFATDLQFLQRSFSASMEAGDLVFAGYAAWSSVWHALEAGEHLDDVLALSRRYAAFAEESHNEPILETIRLQQRFVAHLAGATRAPESDAAASVAVLERSAFQPGLSLHQVIQQQIAFEEGRHDEALAHAARAAEAMGVMATEPHMATRVFYRALTLLALAAGRQEHAHLVDEDRRKLARWAEACPVNFLSRHALVEAEVARAEGRDLEAMRRYEEAIRAAQESGITHHGALACELASRFHRARGFDRIADAYLRDARDAYARWGAGGEVRRLSREHPRLLEPAPATPATTFVAQPEQLDLLSVAKASQSISGEIVLDRLARRLLAVALEQGGAQRACLLLCRGLHLSVEAEAALGEAGTVTSALGSTPEDPALRVPLSVVRYAWRTKERVILGDAAADPGRFASDEYLARARPRSVLCLPIERQAEVIGLLYLENGLLAGAFTSERLVALSLLATQAAISLENARLLTEERAARAAAEDAERRAAFLAETGALLSESLDYEETFARLGRLCVESLADHCFIDIVEGREIHRLAVAHRDPAKEPVLRELQRRCPPRWDSGHPAAIVLRTGEPLLMPALPDEVLRPMCQDDRHFQLLRELGTQTGIAVPLVARGQTLGALTLSSGAPGRSYGRAELSLAQEVARRAAVAIDNARLYRTSQEALRARGDFLTVASHELNTPVTSLMLAVESLRRCSSPGRAVDPEAMTRLLDLVSRQGARLSRLIGDLLDVSRLEAGSLRLDVTEVDLGALVEEVAARFAAALAAARCPLSIRREAAAAGRWDRARVVQVVSNLLSNAIKFGAGAPIEIVVGASRGAARLVVRDHGIGLDPGRCERIFGRFERGVSEHYGGLGLGLYLSRRIVEEHGGSIHCEARPGAGATFVVELPQSESPSV